MTDEDGNIVEKKQIDIQLSSVLPGEIIKTETRLDTKNWQVLQARNMI